MKNRSRTLATLVLTLLITLSLAPSLIALSPNGAHAQRRSTRRRAARPPREKVTQEENIRFPRAGRVKVRAVEARGRLPRLEFVSEATGRRLGSITLGTSAPESYRPLDEPGISLIDPFVRFKALDAEGLPAPLVFAVAVRPGGSDHGFETTLIAARGTGFRVLTTEPLLTSIQGGVFVGDLGGGRGPGAAVWGFIWEDDEVHHGSHRYEVKLYPFDARRGVFRRAAVLRSKQKHERGEDALEELGLPRYTNLLDNFPAIKDYRN
ncbi:MAG TPA: hypothetical protein VFS10_07635 [Pyrinomonadaceae bacterium]|nr:hypothetical protein [Pyrinomonadaceae bacterium]